MRIGKSDPYFGYFTWCEIVGNFVYMGAYESHIAQSLIQGCFSTPPDAVTFDINADEIPAGVTPTQSYGIFSFTAGEFESEREIIPEKILPFIPHVLRIFQHILEMPDRFKADEFFLSHKGAKLRSPALLQEGVNCCNLERINVAT